MGNKDLEAAYYLGKRDGAVAFPFLYRPGIVNENDEIIVLSLVVDLALRSVSTRHGEVKMALARQKVGVVEELRLDWKSAHKPSGP